jgi:hypothetical protein
MPKKIIFRRIRGRLIPIVQKDPSRQIGRKPRVISGTPDSTANGMEPFKVSVFNKLGNLLSSAGGVIFRSGKDKKVKDAYISWFQLALGKPQGKRIGSRSFREVAKSLKKSGFKSISGDISTERQINIRSKLPTKFFQGERELTKKQAWKATRYGHENVTAVTNLQKLRMGNPKHLRAAKSGILPKRRRS